MGLLLPHKRTLRIYPDMISVSLSGGGNHVGGGKRGRVSVFSPESRHRLFVLLHQLKFERVTFCTLTYPAEFPTESRVYKAHLKEYRRRWERLYGACRAVWRLEFQKRGAPHYHIMYLDAPHIPILDWCKLWSDVIHTEDENHRKIGVDVKLVTGSTERGLIVSYLAKYVGKVDDTNVSERSEKPGRWWGKWNIEEVAPAEYEVSDWEAESIVSYALSTRRGGSSWKPANPTICTVFGDSMGGGKWSENLHRLMDEAERAKRRGRSRRSVRISVD